MDWWRDIGLRWGLALVYGCLCFVLLYLFPSFLWPFLIVAYVGYAAWEWWSLEHYYSRCFALRPLTRWDVPEYDAFRTRLHEACTEIGLQEEPVWAVMEDDTPNAMTLGGRRGIVMFTTGILRLMPLEELLALAGHELKHLKTRDSLPAVLGGAWLGLLGGLARFMRKSMERTGARGFIGLVLGLERIFGVLLDLAVMVISLVAEAFLAKRSRHQEQMADYWGTRIAGPDAMISALERLERYNQEKGNMTREFSRWSPEWIADKMYASHPKTEERIRFLQEAVARGELGV